MVILALALLLIPGAFDVVIVIAIVGGLALGVIYGAIYLVSHPETSAVIGMVVCIFLPVMFVADKFYDWKDARAKRRKPPLPKLPPEPWE